MSREVITSVFPPKGFKHPSQARTSAFRLEPLEPRLLLSSDTLPEIGAIVSLDDIPSVDMPFEDPISTDVYPTLDWKFDDPEAPEDKSGGEETSLTFSSIAPLIATASERLHSLGFSSEQLEQTSDVKVTIAD